MAVSAGAARVMCSVWQFWYRCKTMLHNIWRKLLLGPSPGWKYLLGALTNTMIWCWIGTLLRKFYSQQMVWLTNMLQTTKIPISLLLLTEFKCLFKKDCLLWKHHFQQGEGLNNMTLLKKLSNILLHRCQNCLTHCESNVVVWGGWCGADSV